ncbi:hypothetical protein THICB3330019 [Thiomonas sp. CB3]|nr:hypothetical protein THICB3330019 [Thiomonas sp. CB3]
MLCAAPFGLQVVSGEISRIASRSYSGLKLSGAELGMGPAAGVVLGGQRRIAAIRQAAKKQTGIPLRGSWIAPVAAPRSPQRAAWSMPAAEAQSATAPWASAAATQASERAAWPSQYVADVVLRPAWAAQQPGVVAHIGATPERRALLGGSSIGSAPVGGSGPRTVQVQAPSSHESSERGRWSAAARVDSAERAPFTPYARTAQQSRRGPWVAPARADSARRISWSVFPMRSGAALREAWTAAARGDAPERFLFGARSPLQAGWGIVVEPGIPTPGPGDTILIPIQRAYLMLHDISVMRLPDNLAIPASDVAIGIDADSWAWSFSARLNGKTALDAVQPDANGVPVTLEIALDGYLFHVLVEDWSEDRRFGNRSISVKGRGLSAQLAAPYLLTTSGSTTADMTLQQVLNAHLPIGSGWTIAWAAGTPDWLVPAGAWTWADQSAISAIFAACNGVGLTVFPDTATQTLTIQPRYPVLPWDFAAATPQITVPDAAITELGRRNSPPSQANAAFVYGGNVGGILARVYRTGTAGDKALAPAQHPLLTHLDGARLLGSRLLAGQVQQPDVRSLTFPFGGSFGMAQRGALLEAQIGAIATRGIINSVQIATQRTDQGIKIRQTVTIGEDTPNVWAGFSRLMPQDALRLATVQATFADATATVQYPSGGTQRVRNPTGAASGASVYVRGGRIDGTAPSLAQSDILV